MMDIIYYICMVCNDGFVFGMATAMGHEPSILFIVQFIKVHTNSFHAIHCYISFSKGLLGYTCGMYQHGRSMHLLDNLCISRIGRRTDQNK
ncbi:hypothetical protein EUGRSUZ_G00065 [Eucalyptus grandis]|uniref:Uncharacterized protein n=2 Tax=Eucalyptus grandis TaxID=71139 RepID=A0ACC3JZH5_EUCGR|nr:hypothetical protein EUGRSUZ_G00065 [Eucalyptus grandis]